MYHTPSGTSLTMQCNIWPDLSGCPGFKNTALIQEPCLYSPYYTFSISHIYLSKKEGTSDFSHDIGTGTEFNFPLQTIIKLENNVRLWSLRKGKLCELYHQHWKQFAVLVQQGDLKQNRAVPLNWGGRDYSSGICGAEIQKRKLRRGRSQKICMGSPWVS